MRKLRARHALVSSVNDDVTPGLAPEIEDVDQQIVQAPDREPDCRKEQDFMMHRDKKRGTSRSMDVCEEMGLDPSWVVIDHNNEETLEDTLNAGAWAAFTIYPHTKMGSDRMVDIVQEYGSERIIVDSSADWGVSDPLSVPKTAALMIERGVPHEDVVKTTWQNALDVYAQSGQIDEEELLSTAQVDQTQLFSDNSVLRGQEPRVGEAVPN